jgi:cytochrome c-type biogenesis protein
MAVAIFEWLNSLIQSSFIFALIASLIWGILSILLSPCHLASIPLIVGFIGEQGRMTTKKAFWLATSFSVGILITIGVIGLITGLLGRMLGDVGLYGNYFVALIFFLIGLHLLEIIEIPFIGKTNQPVFRKKGILAALILGLIFGIALGPCTFAYMAPMLGIVFTVSTTQFLFAFLLLLFYGIGHCAVIIFAGTFTEVIQRYLNWNKDSKGMVIVKKLCGLLVILGGIYLIWTV